MALYPAADMRTGAISLWVAGDDDAERAAEVVRGLGHTAAPLGSRASERRPLRPGGAAARRAAPAARQVDLAPRRDPRGDGRGRVDASRGYLDSADTRSTLRAVEALGADVEIEAAASRRARSTCASRGSGCAGRASAGAEPARDRRRQRGHPAAPPAGLARGAADGRVDARRRRVDPRAARWTGSSLPLREMGASVECRDERLPPLEVRGRRAPRDLVPDAGRERAGEVVRPARRARGRGRDRGDRARRRRATTPSGCSRRRERGSAPRRSGHGLAVRGRAAGAADRGPSRRERLEPLRLRRCRATSRRRRSSSSPR